MTGLEENWGVPGTVGEVVLPPQPDIEIDPKTREVLDAMFAFGSLKSRIAMVDRQISLVGPMGEADPEWMAELRETRAACEADLPEAIKRYKELSQRHGIFLQ